MNPRIRAVQPHLVEHEGAPYILLVDPLSLSEASLLVPQSIAPLLSLCDGSRDIDGLQKALELYTGIQLSTEDINGLLAKLDEALLLENDNSTNMIKTIQDEFRAARFRPPACSGSAYPSNRDDLEAMLNSYCDNNNYNNRSSNIRGVISPHIDFQRGGRVYAEVWQKASQALSETEIVVIFGTNHLGGRNLFSLTNQNYATPMGIVSTATDVVDSINVSLGNGTVFEDELYHRNEHSIELALVWIQYFLGDRDFKIVPILCGSFEEYINGYGEPCKDTQINSIVNCLQIFSSEKKMLIVAAADLAHMGPAFGDIDIIDESQRESIRKADEKLIKTMRECDPETFFTEIKKEKDARRICGLVPIYMTLRVLGDASGEECGYAQCTADEMNTSLVSICGMVIE